MVSVIIPAHDEAAVIGRCLSALCTGAEEDELDVVVVCNGCRDDTAAVARAFGPPVRVMVTPVASKTHALNLGDEAAWSYPRFYVDADVVLPLPCLRQLAAELHNGRILAAAPRFRMELSGCAWAVRAFYDINQRLPSSREGIGGSGVYGLSEHGRRRFDRFPDLVSDDGFVRLRFAPTERATLADCHSLVYAPRTLRDLVAIKTRSQLGTRQLRRVSGELWRNRGEANRAALMRLCWRPWLWPRLAAYAGVKLAARIRASRQLGTRGPTPAWERDDTSRSVRPAPAR